MQSFWYCKPTDTGLVMNYHAMAPRRYKRGVVSEFVHRIHRACSTWQNFHLGLVKAKQVLEKNQYPSNFYEPIIRDNIEKIVLARGTSDPKGYSDRTRRLCVCVCVSITDFVPRQNLRSAIGVHLVFFKKSCTLARSRAGKKKILKKV